MTAATVTSSRPDMTPPSALACWDEIVRRTAGARLALFLDYDGTLSPIAPTPELATLPEATRETLGRAAARFPVAILSGRGREDVAARVGLPGIVYAGSHGFDISGDGAGSGPDLRHEVGAEIPGEITAAAARLAAEIGGIPGVLLEPKRFALSVHYRLAPEERLPEIERAVDATLAAHPALRKGLGKKLFELRPNLDWDKGRALLWILDRLGLDGSAGGPGVLPIYVGDDLTDEDAFRALAGRGIGILVSHGEDLPRETAATYSLRDPGEVREFLDRLAALPAPVSATLAASAASAASAAEPPAGDDALRRSEALLRQSEERYRTLVEMATEGIWVVDGEARTTYVNPRMAEMLGYTPEEMLGRTSFEFVHPDELPRSTERWASRGEVHYHRREYRFLKKDGSTVWVEASSRPLHDDGHLLGAFGMLTDVTERKEAEAEREALLTRERQARAEAEEANRIKDEFLATVSHELRTPLNAIVSWVHLLRARTPDPATLERALATIDRNVSSQVQIIDDILDVSRIIRGSLALAMQPVDLAILAGQAIESLRPAAEAKGVAIETRLGGGEGTVLGDPDRLRQVIWNLLSNAVKFTPRGGRVELALETGKGEVCIVVADTGSGISPEFLPHVFERFRQADSSTTRVHGGLGLGLAIVRHLIELHGGTVTAESAGQSQGARFTVLLPAQVPSASPEPALSGAGIAAEGAPAPLAGLRILLVDDDRDTSEALTLLLIQAGAEATSANSVREALAAFASSRPDLLLADIGMPEEDGYDLLRQVRALDGHGAAVPAVALTAYARPEDRERALAAGFAAHLAKPVAPEELIAVVRAASSELQKMVREVPKPVQELPKPVRVDF